MFGIEDTWVWLAYGLSIASAILCGVYGLLNWNKGDETITYDDVEWAAHEQEAKRDL